MDQRSGRLWKAERTMRWNTSLFSKHCEIRDRKTRRFSQTANFSLVISRMNGKSKQRTSKRFTKNVSAFSDLNRPSSSGFHARKTSPAKNWSTEFLDKQTPNLAIDTLD